MVRGVLSGFPAPRAARFLPRFAAQCLGCLGAPWKGICLLSRVCHQVPNALDRSSSSHTYGSCDQATVIQDSKA